MAKISERSLGQTGEGSHIKKTKKFEENAYSRVSNRRGGWNKRGGWKMSAKIIYLESAINGEVSKISKLINEEVGVNGEAGKNTAISIVSMEKFMLPQKCLT